MVYATYRIIRDCNAAFASLFGAAREEIIGGSFARLYPEIDDFVRRGRQWASQFGEQGTYYDERLMARLDGQRFWCRVNGRSLAPASDPFAQAVYCFQPINRPVTKEHVLTDRQRQILALVSQGKTNIEIAAETGLSRRTIEAHRARLMRAIGVRNGAELMSWFLSKSGDS